MSPNSIGAIVFACIFGGALLGLRLHPALAEHQRSRESQDVVRLGMALVTSIAALVLGLLIASAKGSYDTRRNDLTQMCANIVLLDRVLAQYGPEANEARGLLRGSLTRILY